MPKRILLLAYDGFAEFEITILLTALRGAGHQLTTADPTADPVRTAGRLIVLPDTAIGDVNPYEYDALIIPGGESSPFLHHPGIATVVQNLHRRGKLVAAICGGPALLAAAGVLDNARYTASLTAADAAFPAVAGRGTRLGELLVTDGNLVTATGSNYVAFAEEVLRHLDGRDQVTELAYFRRPSLD